MATIRIQNLYFRCLLGTVMQFWRIKHVKHNIILAYQTRIFISMISACIPIILSSLSSDRNRETDGPKPTLSLMKLTRKFQGSLQGKALKET